MMDEVGTVPGESSHAELLPSQEKGHIPMTSISKNHANRQQHSIDHTDERATDSIHKSCYHYFSRTVGRCSAPFLTPSTVLFLTFAVLLCLFPPAAAVFIDFDNCLPPSFLQPNPPRELQFVPLFFDAKFNLTDPAHHVNITVYGNVTGQAFVGSYPAYNDPSWTDPNSTFGKITDVDPTNNDTASTLFSKYHFLTYVPYASPPSQFCQSTVNVPCPIPPAFNVSSNDTEHLPGFTVAHNFYSTYSFATIDATITVKSGDAAASLLACVSGNLTPSLSVALRAVLRYIPAALLALVALATLYAAVYSPWSSQDIFRWSSNYGRDEDLLRLVTPGFGDCLGYIQFIVLTGALSLSYPGYYQPVVSQASWSVLMFNESFVSHGNGTESVIDGIYVTNGTYGLDRFRQLVGQSSVKDTWAGMVIWLLVIVGLVTALCQIWFLARWSYRGLTRTTEQDLRSKNLPFTMGNIIRIVYHYFALPLVSLTMFQFVVAGTGPVSVVILAIVFLLIILAGAVWILRRIFTTRPRAQLFDDLPTVLLYGPLYNTYSDDAVLFAVIPLLLNLVRGIAIGAVQPSGIAQLVLLAICEIIMLFTLYAFRPFFSPTSMNAYHGFFTVIRLATILLSVTFVPSLGVSEGTKGWIGYLNLLLHAIVLIFAFFLNAIQTLIEVTARLMGAGGDGGESTRGGLTKVLGVRQLRRRHRRTDTPGSMASNAAILTQDADRKSPSGGRSRSMSASSQALLNRQHQRVSSGFDQASYGGSELQSGPVTPGGISVQTPFSYLPSNSGVAGDVHSGTHPQKPVLPGSAEHPADPYYRRPRQRSLTIDALAAGAGAGVGAAAVARGSGDWVNKRSEDLPEQADIADREAGEGPYGRQHRPESRVGFAAHRRDDSSPHLTPNPRQSTQDYAVREVDFYYGVRGPALSSQPGRKLKTGPGDPMNPVSSAAGWFSNLFKGKSKDKGKGFEVVRSTRVPPEMLPMDDVTSPGLPQEPYHDDPEAQLDGAPHQKPLPSADIVGSYAGHISPERAAARSPVSERGSLDGDPFNLRDSRLSDEPPSLAPIEASGAFTFPSRFNSQSSRAPPDASGSANVQRAPSDAPTVPRRSSRRTPSTDKIPLDPSVPRLPPVAQSPPGSSPARSLDPSPARALGGSRGLLSPRTAAAGSARMPFGATDPSPSASVLDAVSGESAESSRHPSQEELRSGPTPQTAVFRGRNSAAERPTSLGYVQQHRAAETLHSSGALEGQEAELVGEPSPDPPAPGTAV